MDHPSRASAASIVPSGGRRQEVYQIKGRIVYGGNEMKRRGEKQRKHRHVTKTRVIVTWTSRLPSPSSCSCPHAHHSHASLPPSRVDEDSALRHARQNKNWDADFSSRGVQYQERANTVRPPRVAETTRRTFTVLSD